MAKQSLADRKLDKQIEALYYKHGHGVQINIMNINPLFDRCRDAVKQGQDLESAVIDAIKVYREN